MAMSMVVSIRFLAPLVVAAAFTVGPVTAEPRPRIEVAFALDATGSMGPYINEARSKIREIAKGLATGEPAPEVRFALVTYRDKGDAYLTHVSKFTRDIDQMYHYLEAAEAGGGGDLPEAVLEGLNTALTDLSWSKPDDTGVIRLLYLVGDAPPQHYADSPREEYIAAEARRRHIVIHSIACGDGSAAVEQSFEKLPRYTEGRSFRLADSALSALGGRDKTPEFAATLSDTTQAYSSSIGVHFDAKAATLVASTPTAVPPVEVSGLRAREVRWVRNATALSDLWAAHTSLTPEGKRPPPPALDFAHQELLVLGGSDGGLELEAIEDDGTRRRARVKPSTTPGARFVTVELGRESAKGAP
jgi:Mg-chelatase subunit ChlD